jgi:hypothetical protein
VLLLIILILNEVVIILGGAGIAQWYDVEPCAGWSEVRVPTGAGNYSLHHGVHTDPGTKPASYPMGTRAHSLEVKWPGREANH